MISEKGTLKDTHIIKILLKIREQRLTGILYLQKNNITKTLYFSNGNFTWATSSDPQDSMLQIFLQKKIISLETIKPLKDDTLEEASGRFLVEKGLISLEELINGSREQLRRILLSVFSWEEGDFQFTLDKPPERIVSLDIDILKLIWENLQQEFNLELFWKEIGSFHTIYKKKENIFPGADLPQLVAQIFSFLDYPHKLEAIINHFNTYPPQLIVKSIFLLLQLELIEKEISSQPQFTAPPAPPPVEEEEIPSLKSEDSEEQLFNVAEIEERLNREEAPFAEIQHSASRHFWPILIIIAILVLSAAIAYLIVAEKKERSRLLQEFKQQISSEAQPVQESVSEEEEPRTKSEAEPQDFSEQKKEIQIPDTNLKKKEPEPITEEKKISKNQKQSAEETEPVKSSISGLQALINGNLLLAADLFKAEMQQSADRFSILLELDCLKESVITASKKFNSLQNFYILPRQRNNQICFLVLYGRYSSQEEAAGELNKIPEFFWKQSPPPQVINISVYLE